MRFAFLVAWSHLKGRRRTAGVSAIGLVSVVGVYLIISKNLLIIDLKISNF